MGTDMPYSPYRSLAETYDAIRPAYPDALIEDILMAAAPEMERPILEIGAGTGKGTEQFLTRGYSVDAVELEPEMAALLAARMKTERLRLSVGSFENWEPPCRRYQLGFCAQAFHWIDPAVKYKKCYDLLEPKGIRRCSGMSAALEDSAAQRRRGSADTGYFGPAAPLSAGTVTDRAEGLKNAEDFLCLRRNSTGRLFGIRRSGRFWP